MCNGAGVCRKTQTGTMCPSFMATRDEEHSTRGRANALRLALSGALPAEELTGQRMFDTYDLCLECKGCKAECPSNVDVAKLKMEFLHHYYGRHGAPLGVRLMAHAATLNRIGSALAPLSNLAGRLPGAGWLAEKLLGIDRRRPLPAFRAPAFWPLVPIAGIARGRCQRPAPLGPIVLLDDCLTSYCEPAVNRAAVQRAGSGRLRSASGRHWAAAAARWPRKDFWPRPKRWPAQNIQRLLPWAERGVPIVGCEPSCVAMLIDDYLDLVPGDDARLVARQTAMVDCAPGRASRPQLNLAPLNPPDAKILVHGHCHQKALVGVAGTRGLLEQIPGAQVSVVDSGCCGMAGWFGYEHYDLSMQIAERVLLPAVRRHPAGPIVAPGFSCRHQIAHGSGAAGAASGRVDGTATEFRKQYLSGTWPERRKEIPMGASAKPKARNEFIRANGQTLARGLDTSDAPRIPIAPQGQKSIAVGTTHGHHATRVFIRSGKETAVMPSPYPTAGICL